MHGSVTSLGICLGLFTLVFHVKNLYLAVNNIRNVQLLGPLSGLFSDN